MSWESILVEFLPETIPTWLAGVIVLGVAAFAGYRAIMRVVHKPCWVRRFQCSECKQVQTTRHYDSRPDFCQSCGGEISKGKPLFWYDGEKYTSRDEMKKQEQKE